MDILRALVGASAIAAILLTAGCAGQTPAQNHGPQPVKINVSAAISLQDALKEIQQQYEAAHPQVKIALNLGASGTLAQQIEQGAPADIFISAATAQMNELNGQKLIAPGSLVNLVRNELVLIVPQQSKVKPSDFAALRQSDIHKIAMGEPTVVPAGQYARQTLQNLGIWDDIQAKTVLAKDVRTVLAYVETGNVDAGLVYRTDAAGSGKVRVAATAPAATHDPIVYPAAILASAQQRQEVGDFYAYLTGPASQAVFAKYGFAPGR